jgi:hypothetical protein
MMNKQINKKAKKKKLFHLPMVPAWGCLDDGDVVNGL